MKANELTIGQKYIWKRNSSVSHEVTYLGCDDSRGQVLYDFEYIKNGEKRIQSLPFRHVEVDITEQLDTERNTDLFKLIDLDANRCFAYYTRGDRESVFKKYKALHDVCYLDFHGNICISDLTTKSSDMKKIEVRKYKSWKQKGGIILYEDLNNGLQYLNNNIWSKENPFFGNVNPIVNIEFVIID